MLPPPTTIAISTPRSARAFVTSSAIRWTTAALRAAEIGADAVLKGTHSGVDGVYSADPRLDPDAVKLETVTHLDVIQRGLHVMDSTAITFCMDNSLPIIVFDVMQPGNITKALTGEPIGTLVHPKETK